jgi:hypothetical protein
VSANPQAKPTDQVGFTQVFKVEAPEYTHIVKGSVGSNTATCPAGSTVIGGYHVLTSLASAADFIYVGSGLDGANGWVITGWANLNGNSSVVNVDVFAICVK